MNDLPNGYGILIHSNGDEYHGEFKDDEKEGYGLMKYRNTDEYNGEWKSNCKHGEGVFTEAESGKIKRRLYYKDNRLKSLVPKKSINIADFIMSNQ
jgi:hypothetical protein